MAEDTLCKRYRPYLVPLIDDALEPALSEQVLTHVAACDACQADLLALEESKHLVAASFSEVEVPSPLWPRIQTSLRHAIGPRASRQEPARRWQVASVTAILAVVMLAVGVWIGLLNQAEQPLWPDLPAKELRAFIDSGRPVDVAVNDPQQLRDWFRPRLAFELPPLDVTSISANGAKLIGGRLCYFFDRRIASYMFSVDGRILSLYIMQSGGLPKAPAGTVVNQRTAAPIVRVANLTALFWSDNGLTYFLVGELPEPDLARLAERLLKRSTPTSSMSDPILPTRSTSSARPMRSGSRRGTSAAPWSGSNRPRSACNSVAPGGRRATPALSLAQAGSPSWGARTHPQQKA